MSEMIIEPIERYGLNISAENKNKPLFSKIGVVGAGKEGRNIINMAASAGMEVIFLEESPERIEFVTGDRKSTRLNSSHVRISYAVFCLKKKKKKKKKTKKNNTNKNKEKKNNKQQKTTKKK